MLSDRDITTGFAGDMEKLYKELNQGRPVRASLLALIFNMSEKGILTLIHIMRRRGVPIINIRGKGYMIARNPEDINKESIRFRRIGGGYFKTAKAIKGGKPPVQLTLFKSW